MEDLPKLGWSRDVTGKVDNIHSNLTHSFGGKSLEHQQRRSQNRHA